MPLAHQKPASHVIRDAQRTALRTHPLAQQVLRGRTVNLLNKAELLDGLVSLGMDPDAIARAALAGGVGGYLSHATRSPSGIAPQGRDDEEEEETARMRETEEEHEEAAPDFDAIEAELQTIRSLVTQGGFSALDDRLRELVREARKPAVEIVREVFVPGTAPQGNSAAPQVIARRTGRTDTWRSLFGVRGALGATQSELWDGAHPSTPQVNNHYIWPQPQTAIALTQVKRGRNVYLCGPKGTGKTDWAQQLAARTGRPFALISCDDSTDAPTLVGMTVPSNGGVGWQDGQLTRAIRLPGCVVCIDEPSMARPGALAVFMNVLQNRRLFIGETGETVPVADRVVFLAADNTNGTGGGARRGYVGTQRLNAAFLDRFGAMVQFDYMPAGKEADLLVAYTGCTVELAKLLVTTAQVTRTAAESQTLSHGIGLRRLLSWAELLTDGIGCEEAFAAAVLNGAPEADVETLREQCLLSYDKATVAAALNPGMPQVTDPTVTNPTPAGRDAAGDFPAYATRTTY